MTTHIPRPHGLSGSLYYAFYVSPHDREPRQAGEVTAILARPEHLPDAVQLFQDLDIEGDSHLAMCRPAVDVDSPNRQLKFEVNLGATEVIAMGAANSNGFLGQISLRGLPIADAYSCETVGLGVINPILSLLSFENDIPLYIRQIHVKPADTNRTFVRVMNLFRAKRHGNRQHTMMPQFAHVAAAYRAGLNLLSFSPQFAFVCFHQVMEAASKTGLVLRTTEKQRMPAHLAELTEWVRATLDDNSVTDDDVTAAIPKEAYGKKYTWVQERLRAVRNKIAHGAYEEENAPQINSLDDPDILLEANKWMPLARLFAKRMLKDTIRDVEFGVPPALALQEYPPKLGDPTTSPS